MKILFSNLGYFKNIDGALKQHILCAGRHIYCTPTVQQRAINQFRTIIQTEQPDICCLVEVDRGSFHSGYYNQLGELLDDTYRYHDIADKYGENSMIGRLPLHKGKSNAFLSKHALPFERLYFSHGTKRLVYRLALPDNRQLFFTHFSLQKKVRHKQFQEIQRLIRNFNAETVLMADFNILRGPSELTDLLRTGDLTLLNREDEHTFTFHRRRLMLDLCMCSNTLAPRAELRVIPQPYSDHAALLLTI